MTAGLVPLRWLLAGLLALAGCAPTPPALPPLIDSVPTPRPTEEPPMPGEELLGPLVFDEDFERGADAWSIEPGAIGFRLFASPMCGGAFVMLFGRAERAPVTGPAEGVLERRAPIDLSTTTRPWLKYDVLGEADPPEAIMLVAEVRGQDGAWVAVGRPALGRYAIVRTFAADLTPYKDRPVWLRFRVRLGASQAPTRGLMLDDVRVIEPREQRPHPLS